MHHEMYFGLVSLFKHWLGGAHEHESDGDGQRTMGKNGERRRGKGTISLV